MNRRIIKISLCLLLWAIGGASYALPVPVLSNISTGRMIVGEKNSDRKTAVLIKCTVQSLDSLVITDIQALDTAGVVLGEVKGLKKVSFKGKQYWYNKIESFVFEAGVVTVYIKLKDKEMDRVAKFRFIFKNGSTSNQLDINY